MKNEQADLRCHHEDRESEPSNAVGVVPISFSHHLSAERSMIFEKQFEPELRPLVGRKAEQLAYSTGAWLYVGDRLAGECYGSLCSELNEEIPDIDSQDEETFYLYSISVLPEFKHRGLGRLLLSHWLGIIAGKGCRRVVWHATSPEMVRLSELFSARYCCRHDNWFDSGRSALFYTLEMQELRQT